ncbi:MAG: hypothetical protein M3Z03_06010 [Actinomycetota bacterium]|nr:hypothetical protein [Actinomycetota bacterium]
MPRALAMSVAAMALVVAVLGMPTRSQAASTFTASAGGEIVRAVLKLVPPLLQEELLDPGAVTAQASLTSFGESTAFSSTPYPGSVPVSAPGLVDGLLGSTPGIPPELLSIVNVPDYPLIATSSFPSTPSSNVTVGTLSMDAQSRARESAAITTDGINRTEARVVADDTSDVVTAKATSVVGSVDVGPLLQLGGVRSSATVTQDADGDLDRSTEFSVASLSVLGTQLRVTNDGIELAGINLPVGLGSVLDPVQQLLAALQDQGTSIRFVDATETTDGVISAGLIVESTFDLGVNGIVATVTITLGRTFASVSNAARPGLDDVDLSDGGGVDLGSGSGFDAGSGGGFDGVDGLPSSPGAPAAPAGVGGTERIRALVPDRTDAGGFYPVLVVGGAVFLIGISLFRKIGVRSTWTS